jgi:hypothetical protein
MRLSKPDRRYEEVGEAGLRDRRIGKASGRRVPVDRSDEGVPAKPEFASKSVASQCAPAQAATSSGARRSRVRWPRAGLGKASFGFGVQHSRQRTLPEDCDVSRRCAGFAVPTIMVSRSGLVNVKRRMNSVAVMCHRADRPSGRAATVPAGGIAGDCALCKTVYDAAVGCNSPGMR